MIRVLAAILIVVAILPGCDDSAPDIDLFLLPILEASSTFNFPADTLLTFESTQTYNFSMDGPFQEGPTFSIISSERIDFGALLPDGGLDAYDIQGATIGVSRLTLLSPTSSSSDLSDFNEITLYLANNDGAQDRVFRETNFPASDEISVLDIDNISPAVFMPPPTSGMINFRLNTIPDSPTINLRTLLPIAVTYRATQDLRSSQRFYFTKDVRSFVRNQAFDIGDIERARVSAVTITPVNPGLFESRVRSIIVSVTPEGDDVPPVQVTNVLAFGDEIEVSSDITDAVRRTGSLRINLDLNLQSTQPVDLNALRFNVNLELKIEVPQPSSSSGA